MRGFLMLQNSHYNIDNKNHYCSRHTKILQRLPDRQRFDIVAVIHIISSLLICPTVPMPAHATKNKKAVDGFLPCITGADAAIY